MVVVADRLTRFSYRLTHTHSSTLIRSWLIVNACTGTKLVIVREDGDEKWTRDGLHEVYMIYGVRRETFGKVSAIRLAPDVNWEPGRNRVSQSSHP